jgi:polysaccharide biosynthesis/export protein
MDDNIFCFPLNDSIFVQHRKMTKQFSILLLLLISLSSCVPNRMFRTPKDFEYARDSSTTTVQPFRIQPGDQLQLRIFSNDGFKLVDITQTNSFGNAPEENFNYRVEENGEVKFPVIGRINLKDLNIKESEDLLQQKYSKYYNDPFVLLTITNRHVIVFLGENGKGTVVPLTNDNTNLYEVLALAGGISEFSQSFRIKILRGDPHNPKIYKADLSKHETLRTSELKVFSNDIIYVDSGFNFSRRITAEFLPILGIFTSLLVVYSNLNK